MEENTPEIQAEMTTRCEIAFKALDMNNTGYVTAKHIKKLTPKLSQAERDGLMAKVRNCIPVLFQLRP